MPPRKQVGDLTQILDGLSIHGELPHAHDSFRIRRDYAASIGEESRAIQTSEVSQGRGQRISGVGAPNPSGSIQAGCYNPFTIRAEGGRFNRGFMMKSSRELAARKRVPNQCLGILAGGNDARPIGTERGGGNPIPMVEFKFEPARGGMPDSSLAFYEAVFNLTGQ